MEAFQEYLNDIPNPQHRDRMAVTLQWVDSTFPQLAPRIAWNQPMFTDHGTFIIGFGVAKAHMAVAPEQAAIQHFADELTKAGYVYSSQLIRIRWNQSMNYDLLSRIITFNLEDKADCPTFWRKTD